MSIAPLEAKCSMVRLTCAGHATFSQRRSTSPSGSTTGWPHTGQRSGIRNLRSRLARSETSTRDTFGMTSPPFSTSTASPTLMSMRSISCWLWSVARDTVEPATSTGSRTATGVSLPVLPTWTTIPRTVVLEASAANL